MFQMKIFTMKLNKDYWQNRYLNNETGWDIGHASMPIINYINQIENKNLKILIPGAGNCYELDYLINKGFKNITIIDIADIPIQNIIKRNPTHINHIKQIDFFEINETFDLILEQTFFCALDPNLREKYVEKSHQILNKNGKIAGLLFDFELTNEGPPFGGNTKEYKQLFNKLFNIKTLEKCYNSIKPRENRELFIIFEKK